MRFLMDVAECHPTRMFQLIEDAVEHGQLDMLKQFLISGYVNINTFKNPSGLTMLMVAARRGHVHIVSFLLDQNVEIEIQDFEGKTALFFAAWCGHTEIVDLLLKRGANLFAISNQGANPLLLSLECGNKETVFRLLAAAIQCTEEVALNSYMTQTNAVDIMLEFKKHRMDFRNKLADIFRPIILSQNGFELSHEHMHMLCQQFPLWYICLIKADLEVVCSMLYDLKQIDEHLKQQFITPPSEAPIVFSPVANHTTNNNTIQQTAPAPFIPKRKADNDVDGDRGNKRQKKEEPMQF